LGRALVCSHSYSAMKLTAMKRTNQASAGPTAVGRSGLRFSMVGARCTLCLVVLAGGANALLTGSLQTPCANSDGLPGYSFSHNGLWIPGYNLLGTGFTKQTCSAECTKLKSCVAFSGAFKENGGNGGCYTYAATGGNVRSGTDRAYKKCQHASEELSADLTSMHLVARTQAPVVIAVAQTTAADLATMAQVMEAQLDVVSKTMVDADLRMKRLKNMVAGSANILTAQAAIATGTAKTTLGNRGGLLAIARSKENTEWTLAAIGSGSARIDGLLKGIEARKTATTTTAAPKKGALPTKSLRFYEPNVTALEKKLNKLNDPATFKEIKELETAYTGLENNISSTVKLVLRSKLRGLVDTQRVAFRNYTDALADIKKDPCCCK